jgi:hypothetical protein
MNVKKPKLIEINILVLEVTHHLIITVSRLVVSMNFIFIFILDDRWNDYDDSNNNNGENKNTTRKKDFVELDGRWRSTNPSIFEEGFNKAEDLASKVKELVLDQRRPSNDHSPEIR